MIGFSEFVFLAAIVTVVVYFKRLPEAAKGVKRAIQNFKEASQSDDKNPVKNVTPPSEAEA